MVTDAETWFTLDLKAHEISREAISGLMAEWGRGRLYRCKTLHFVLHDDVFSGTSAEERHSRKEQPSGQSLVQKEITQKKKIIVIYVSVSTKQSGYFLRNSFPQMELGDLRPPGCIAAPLGLSPVTLLWLQQPL